MLQAEGGTAWNPAGPPGSARGGGDAHVGLQRGRISGKTPDRRTQTAGSRPQSRVEAGAVPGAPCPAALLVQHPPLVLSPRLRAGAARGPPAPFLCLGEDLPRGEAKQRTPPARPKGGSEVVVARWDTRRGGGSRAPVGVGSALPSPLHCRGDAVPQGQHGATEHSGGHSAHPLSPTSPPAPQPSQIHQI